jgi:glucuronate isomerase
MTGLLELDPNRLFPVEPACRSVARELYEGVRNLPIISPHGHTDPAWFARNEVFADPYTLLVKPDHYLIRMLYSRGVSMAELAIDPNETHSPTDLRSAWRTFARHQHLFLGTPSGFWLEHVFREIFGQSKRLDESTADEYYDDISEQLQKDEFRPREIFDRFRIEFLATTESAIDTLQYHREIQASDWNGRVVTTYRPDSVIDPEHPRFLDHLALFGAMTGEDVNDWNGYLRAHRKRRADFMALGATATDHGHPTARTADMSETACRKLFRRNCSALRC